jgi:hypothetical protein
MDLNKEPDLMDKAKNLSAALVNWAREDGFHRVSPETYEKRKSICMKCEFWEQEGFGGLGKCKLCGCSVAKLYIPSSNCPHHPPKWTSVSAK